MGSATLTIRVFYSWQSDRPDECNRGFIRECLKAAKAVIEADKSTVLNIYIDEATRDEPGAPEIAATILNKIEASDVVVFDVSIIKDVVGGERPTPNPNVLVELGFAAGRIGWPRILLVFNAAFGVCPAQLPFDIRGRRTKEYYLAAATDPSKRGNVKKNLVDALVGHIREIAAKNPGRPTNEDDSGIRRARDAEMLSVLCGTFDLAALQLHCETIQRGFVTAEVSDYHDAYAGLLNSLSFHLYDEGAKRNAIALYKAWSEAMPGSRFTELMPGGYGIKSRGGPWRKEEEEELDRLSRSWKPLYDAINGFAKFVRENYLEIDLLETSRRAKADRAELLAKIDFT